MLYIMFKDTMIELYIITYENIENALKDYDMDDDIRLLRNEIQNIPKIIEKKQ